jgi:predicted nucleic acid-binding protein
MTSLAAAAAATEQIKLGLGVLILPLRPVAGREPRKRASDLMIAATAASNQLPLYTANPDDFTGGEGFVEVVGIRARPNNR